MQTNLNGLAARIARNRELAGFHYPSDTAGGMLLAQNILDMLTADSAKVLPDVPTVQGYIATLDAAKAEWA